MLALLLIGALLLDFVALINRSLLPEQAMYWDLCYVDKECKPY